MRIATPSIGVVAVLPLFVLALSAQVSPAKPQVLVAGGQDFLQSHSSAELFESSFEQVYEDAANDKSALAAYGNAGQGWHRLDRWRLLSRPSRAPGLHSGAL